MLTLLVRAICKLVLHLARKSVYAGGLLGGCGVAGGLGTRGKLRGAVVVFLIAALGCDIVECDGAVQAAVLLSLLWAQCGEESGVIVWMRPDASRRIGLRINKKLVLLYGVELSDPSRGKFAILVFHRAAVLWGNSISCCS